MTSQARGFVLLQSTVAVLVAAVLIMVMLARTQQYYDEAERRAVDLTVDTLRTALSLRVTRAHGHQLSAAELSAIAAENPFDWLTQKPDNYLGEYYSPELKNMPVGNWLFDRRDRSLIYLFKSHESFSSNTSKFLKFKVEFAQARLPGVKNGPAEVPNGLEIDEVDDPTASNTD